MTDRQIAALIVEAVREKLPIPFHSQEPRGARHPCLKIDVPMSPYRFECRKCKGRLNLIFLSDGNIRATLSHLWGGHRQQFKLPIDVLLLMDSLPPEIVTHSLVQSILTHKVNDDSILAAMTDRQIAYFVSKKQESIYKQHPNDVTSARMLLEFKQVLSIFHANYMAFFVPNG